ncbi:MAG: hypothetical protein MMC33_009954, partial [Icmadophila ericetorum]|nr:hypothetical protein [Icmadophila ericetorum]
MEERRHELAYLHRQENTLAQPGARGQVSIQPVITPGETPITLHMGPSGLEQGADQVYEKSSHLTPYKETPKFFRTPIRHPKMQTCYSLAANKHARHSFQAPLVRPAGMLALPHSTFTPGRADGDATMRQGSVGLDTQASGSLASSLLSHVHRVPL